MRKVSQPWDVIYTWGCLPSRSQTIKTAVGIYSTGSANYQAIPPGGCYDKVPMTIDGLLPLSHTLWMHGKGLKSLGCNIYMGMPSIQATDHQNCGTRFYKIYTPPSHPQGGCYDKVPMAIYGLPPFADVLCMYGKYLTSLGCNTYIGMHFIQATDHQNCCGPRFYRVYKPPIPPQGVWVVI